MYAIRSYYDYFKENYSIKNIEVVKEYPNLAFTGALPTLLTKYVKIQKCSKDEADFLFTTNW